MAHDIAIVTQTVCRASLLRAARSVFSQAGALRIHLLIGVDVARFASSEAMAAAVQAEAPANVTVTWLDVGYSTSARHGGVHACRFGGALRSVLSFLADARHVVYLDDDDWLHPEHCRTVLAAVQGVKWAFPLSIYADGDSGEPLGVDGIESVGVGAGIYAQKLGGFVRPSGLCIDKLALLHVLHLWSRAGTPAGDGEDRLIFNAIRTEPHRCTGRATVYCAIDPSDAMHATRLAWLRSQGVSASPTGKIDSVR
ncbi:MAG TPA: hypothetical protein VG248_18215 [Caulobacteraceae bacterium]|nr:hypothetical protein [Caulobacteraceae bacterium]